MAKCRICEVRDAGRGRDECPGCSDSADRYVADRAADRYVESLGGSYSSPGRKITATRPLPEDISDSGIPKPTPIPSVHGRNAGWAER
jgi:hypothetical protein